MRFGASIADGGVRFSLWAPAMQRVQVHIQQDGRLLPLRRDDAGWFDLWAPDLRAGTLYRYVIDDLPVPDPASRFQPLDVSGPSEVIDPTSFEWNDSDWRGRPWHEAVISEIHIGTFTTEGTFAVAVSELEQLARIGVTAVELMPVADFAGARNWGYDGVLPFAPDSQYGRPEDLKRFVSAAHRLGLMVFIDVVYNHFGPEGNYLARYAPQFFSPDANAWGQSINFTEPMVRQFFIENALYWLTEFHADGLRLDAVHAIRNDGVPGFLDELANAARGRFGNGRHIHLILENDNNEARLLERSADGRARAYDAQWNDDFHHALHLILTGESDGYYGDYADQPWECLCRSLTEGFTYQGEWSRHRGRRRGERSGHLPSTAFVNFLQNHDQVGNRAFGERLIDLVPLERLAAAVAILLLAPSPPLLFMGDEWGARTPFLFFCDFKKDLAEAVRKGRRREFARFAEFARSASLGAIPDPQDIQTFEASRLDRSPTGVHPELARLYQQLLQVRHRQIIPRLSGMAGTGAGYRVDAGLCSAWWRLADGSRLRLDANLSDDACSADVLPEDWSILYATSPNQSDLLPWSVLWRLQAERQL